MKSRCYNQKDISYKNYGLRGIKVCTEWLNYNNFAEWSLKNGFEEGLELDRIDTNDNYKPSNCRYISHLENGGSVSLEVLLDLCDALDITPDYLLFGTIRASATDNLLDMLKLCDDYEISILSDLAESLIKRRKKQK